MVSASTDTIDSIITDTTNASARTTLSPPDAVLSCRCSSFVLSVFDEYFVILVECHFSIF